MASGHVSRANRPNTWLHRPALHVKKTLASREPSTHGTNAKNEHARLMSDSDPKAAVVRLLRHFSEVPKGDIAPSLDRRVGAGEERGRYLEAERFCSLEVDDEFELRRLFYREIGRVGAFQNLIHESCRSAENLGTACCVGHQAANL